MKYDGQKHYEVLNALLRDNEIIKINKGVEIGVRFGDTAEYLCRNNPDLHLVLIDPYIPYQDIYDFYTDNMQQEIKNSARARFYDANVSWVYKPSVEAAEQFKNDKFDFAFIDANHTYDNVMADIHAWYPLIREGGLLTGHDYNMEGVKKAVDLWAKTYGKIIFETGPVTNVWAIEM